MGGSSGSSTTVMTSIPPYLDGNGSGGHVLAYLDKAKLIAFDPSFNFLFENYGGTTYTPGLNYAPMQTVDGHIPEQEGIDNMATRGRNGNTTIAKGVTFAENVIDGAYLPGSRPEFQAMLTNATLKPENSFTTISNDLGATLYLVGDLSAQNLAQDLTVNTPARYINRTEAIMYNQNYRQERVHQGASISNGPEYANQDIIDAEMLRMAGVNRRIFESGTLKEKYDFYYETQASKIRRVEVLGNAVRTLTSSRAYQQGTTPYYKKSPLVGMAGGALAGAPAGPWGIAAGAALGLMGSL